MHNLYVLEQHASQVKSLAGQQLDFDCEAAEDGVQLRCFEFDRAFDPTQLIGKLNVEGIPFDFVFEGFDGEPGETEKHRLVFDSSTGLLHPRSKRAFTEAFDHIPLSVFDLADTPDEIAAALEEYKAENLVITWPEQVEHLQASDDLKSIVPLDSLSRESICHAAALAFSKMHSDGMHSDELQGEIQIAIKAILEHVPERSLKDVSMGLWDLSTAKQSREIMNKLPKSFD